MSRSRTQKLKDRGFDQSSYDRSSCSWDVRCSCCEATVINGTPTHERGCPNEKERDE